MWGYNRAGSRLALVGVTSLRSLVAWQGHIRAQQLS